MKTQTILTVALLLLTELAAQGRLGETPRQCAQRYGEPLLDETSNDGRVGEYEKSGVRIHVEFLAEKSLLFVFGRRYRAVLIRYRKVADEAGGGLQQEEIDTFLAANSQKQSWRELDPVMEATRLPDTDSQVRILRDGNVRTRWVRADGAAAVYDRALKTLEIRAQGGNQSSGKAAAQGLEGF
jgi:hypothetical protein